ncbi:MAG: hypothetical protein KIT18_06860, partial [Burkholderiales bacterium]|nr:hypothetical protein [Burkholderiales bacterium]
TRGTPVMLVFTQASCIHCSFAKSDHLIPMDRSAELRDKVIIREIDIDRRAGLRDFGGRTVTPRELAKRYDVQRVPTVIVTDDDGKPVSPPIIGLLADDFYRLYLQQAIDAGRIKMKNRGR